MVYRPSSRILEGLISTEELRYTYLHNAEFHAQITVIIQILPTLVELLAGKATYKEVKD